MSRLVDAAQALQAVLPQPGSRGYDHWFGRLEVDALRRALDEQQSAPDYRQHLVALETALVPVLRALAALCDSEGVLVGVRAGKECDDLTTALRGLEASFTGMQPEAPPYFQPAAVIRRPGSGS